MKEVNVFRYMGLGLSADDSMRDEANQISDHGKKMSDIRTEASVETNVSIDEKWEYTKV